MLQSAIKAFFKDLSRFFSALATEAKSWTALASVNIKAASENLGAGVDLVGKLVGVLPGVGAHFKVGEAQIGILFGDAKIFFDHLGELAASFGNAIEKNVRKFGERLAPGVDLFGPLIEVLKNMLDLKDVPDTAFDIIDSALHRIVDRIGGLADFFAKSWLKAIAFFSENVSPGVDLWKATIDTIKSMVDVPVPTETDFDNLFDSLKAGVTRMVAFAADLTTEGLSKAGAVAVAVLPIAAAIKAWMEVSGLVRGYTAIAKESWQAAVDDFAKGLNWLNSLMVQALDYLARATRFNEIVTAGNVQLGEGIGGFAAAAMSAFAKLNDTFGSIGGGETFPQGASASGSFGAQSLGSFSNNSASSGSGTTVQENHFHFHAPVGSRSQMEDWVYSALKSGQSRLRNA